MYKIGEFSKLTKITVKMLRHYDSIGLLKPSSVDSWTGYRIYLPSQLPKAYKIVVLKNLGLSLKEIRNIIDNDNIDNIINKLSNKIIIINNDIKSYNHKLNQIKSYIKILKEESNMKYDVIIKTIPEVIVASMRRVIKGYEEFNTMFPEMGEYMKEQKCTCVTPGYCFTIFHGKEYKSTNVDVEICEAVTNYAKNSDTIKFKKVLGYTMACSMHKGPYNTIGSAYNAVFNWVKENGYEVIDDAREVYYDGIWNKDSEEDYLTEVQVPIKKKD